MADPKPIVLTQAETNPSAQDPQPFVVVGDIPVDSADLLEALDDVAGYDAGETQTLKHVSGVLTWVTDA